MLTPSLTLATVAVLLTALPMGVFAHLLLGGAPGYLARRATTWPLIVALWVKGAPERLDAAVDLPTLNTSMAA